jgi:hypothetical protein
MSADYNLGVTQGMAIMKERLEKWINKKKQLYDYRVIQDTAYVNSKHPDMPDLAISLRSRFQARILTLEELEKALQKGELYK